MATKVTKSEQADCLARLVSRNDGSYLSNELPIIHEGQTVHVLQTAYSASGMTRWVRLYVIEPGDGHGAQGEPTHPDMVDRPNAPSLREITSLVAKACGFTYDDRRDAIKIGGCGFHVGHDVVDTVAKACSVKGLRYHMIGYLF